MSGVQQQQQEMKFEEARLATFRDWPANAKVEAWKMARAGLLYTGQDEEVKCTFCGCLFSDWQYGDQVMSKHRQASPDCPFVKNQSDNVPLVPGGGSNGISSSSGGVEDQRSSGSQPADSGFGSHEETDDGSHFSSRSSVLESEDEGAVEMEDAHRTEQDMDMKHESARLATFHNWPLSFIRREDLAKAGFFFLNQRDNCRCAFCGNYVGDWDEGDVPMEEHRKLFPLCGFVRGLDVGNISIESEASTSSGRASPGHDETGLRWHRAPHSMPEKGYQPQSFQEQYPETLGVISHHGPLHPSYATLEARLRTFRDWPPALKQQPSEFADAGFYYIGLSDQVKCFYCDGGLRNWQPEDDPWVEHARWFSKCVFVRLRKGDDYIRSCLAAKPPDSSEEMMCSEHTEQREVTENEVRAVMSEAIVRQVLSMGIDASRVKMAVKRQLEHYGANFDTPEHLISAAFSVQREQERRVINENNNPSGALLGTSEERRGRDEVTAHWEGLSQPSLPQLEEEENMDQQGSLRPPAPAVRVQQPLPTTASTVIAAGLKSPVASTSAEVTMAPASRAEPTKDDPEALERENARLKEARTCKVCMDNEIGVVFLPCGHLICCVNCAPSLKDCPMCRTNIQGTVRTFLS